MQDKNGGGYNGNGHDPDEQDDDNNVIKIPTLAERDKQRREKEKEEKKWQKTYRKENPGEPLINLPPVTKFAVLSLLLIHLGITFLASPVQQYSIFEHFGFVPAHYTGTIPFSIWAIIGPFTYIFIHGSWTHIIMNTVMLTAFGSGMERWIGGKRMFVFFILCSLASVLAHLILNPSSTGPVIGASGGLSGMFAAILLLMQQQGIGPKGRFGIWPFVLFWVGVSFVLGTVGGIPGDDTIAWAAHIGGFLAGFVFLKPVMKYIR